MAYVVAANQGASLQHYGPFSWPGGSMVVDYDGRILAQAEPGPGEKIVVAEIDLDALRVARQQRLGHNPLAHLRREAYGTRARQGYPAASFVSAKDPNGNRTVEENEAAIRTVVKSEG
jgi:predicted amidohydrolase